jgi:hypothetical protein
MASPRLQWAVSWAIPARRLISPFTFARLERDARGVPPSVEKLALMYARHGIPKECLQHSAASNTPSSGQVQIAFPAGRL